MPDEGGYTVDPEFAYAIQRIMWATLLRRSNQPYAKLICSATSIPSPMDVVTHFQGRPRVIHIQP